MSSSSIGITMTIEPEELQISFPEQPKKTVQYRAPPLILNDQRDFEMHPIATPSIVLASSSGDNNVKFQGSGRISSDENQDEQRSGPISEQIQTVWNPYKNRFRVMAACSTSMANGMNDSAPGALIASIERYENRLSTQNQADHLQRLQYCLWNCIHHFRVQCSWIYSCCLLHQCIVFKNRTGENTDDIGVLIDPWTHRNCHDATISRGSCIVNSTSHPEIKFLLRCDRFFVLGVGMAMNLAICQVFCANLANNTAVVGAYQGAYGIGGITGPLIATALVSRGNTWSRFYTIELGLAALNLFVIPWAFWKYELESDHEQQVLPHPASEQSGTRQRKWRSFKTLLSDRTTVLGALFIFAYQGSEVAISGWVISFLVQFRHGDPSKVGYVTSGFWAGITLGEFQLIISSNLYLSQAGRFTLSFLAHRMGERLFVFIVSVGVSSLPILP
jgi:hypothetical protein